MRKTLLSMTTMALLGLGLALGAGQAEAHSPSNKGKQTATMKQKAKKQQVQYSTRAPRAGWADRVDSNLRQGLVVLNRNNRTQEQISGNGNLDMPNRPPYMQGRNQLPGGPLHNR